MGFVPTGECEWCAVAVPVNRERVLAVPCRSTAIVRRGRLLLMVLLMLLLPVMHSALLHLRRA